MNNRAFCLTVFVTVGTMNTMARKENTIKVNEMEQSGTPPPSTVTTEQSSTPPPSTVADSEDKLPVSARKSPTLEQTDIVLLKYYLSLLRGGDDQEKSNQIKPVHQMTRLEKMRHLREIIEKLKEGRDGLEMYRLPGTSDPGQPGGEDNSDMALLRYLALLQVQTDKRKDNQPVMEETPVACANKSTAKKEKKKCSKKKPNKVDKSEKGKFF